MDKPGKKKKGAWIKAAAAAAFWLLLWQLAVMRMENTILVASPVETVKTLIELLQTAEFWKTVGTSFVKIALGFFLAVGTGILFAVAASFSGLVRALLNPLLRLIKAVPVASFIILALFWLSTSRNLSVLISFLMVLPVIYTNVLQGIASTEPELLEMARVFRIPFGKRLRYIYIPAVLPYFVSACSVGLGFCFKSGIAAEVIGLPQNSIGAQLYEAKLYLMTAELFAWTAVIVMVSVVFEKLVMLLVRLLAGALTGTLRKQGAGQEEAVLEAGILLPEEGDAGETGILLPEEGDTGEAGILLPEARIDMVRKSGMSADPREEILAEREEEIGREGDRGAAAVLPDTGTPEEYGLFDVTKRFDDKTVLEQFTLRLRQGETVALMGASGCGKSTAGKLFLGLLEADGGTVRRPERMGAVFQEDRLCKEFDAVTNIAMVTGNRREAEEALAAVGLSGIRGRQAAALSGGMKRRVAILRALLSEAEVLVLDEPFTGLDAAGKQKVVRYVKEKLQGRSALLITHSKDEAAALADRIVPLEQDGNGKR